MLTTLITNNVSTTADDNLTVVSPIIANPNMIVVQHPYAEEKTMVEPHIVVGPMAPVKAIPLNIGKPVAQGGTGTRQEFDYYCEVHVRVQNVDVVKDGTNTSKITGVSFRPKLVDALTQVLRKNQANPDGTGTYDGVSFASGPKDADDPERPYEYHSVLLMKIVRFDSF